MQVFDKITAIQTRIVELKKEGNNIGFVPTMGALHDGHISLIEQCAIDNDITVASIFVNPIQFNNKNDLKNYPRTLDEDLKKLDDAGCDIVFVPSVEEMYPEEETQKYSFGALETVMEGKFRPGHFNGVAVVVKKLFDIVMPDNAYFGKKDFQQLAIIKSLVKQINYNINIVACETKREDDGLAMSSRNTLLSNERRLSATKISEALFKSVEIKQNKSVTDTKEFIVNYISDDANLEVEYVEIVDSNTLQPIENWIDTDEATVCVAIINGNVRLIDNLQY
jgi:pantoate--beta-alanine ligase